MQGIGPSAAWIVLGMGFVAMSDNLLVMVSDRVGLWQFQIMRSGTVLPVLVLGLWIAGGLALLRPRSVRRVAERSSLSVLALMLYFAALPGVGIAQASAGLFTSPIWLVVIGGLLLGEGTGPRRIAAVAIGFVGVLLVLEIGAAPFKPMTLLAVAAGGVYATGVIWTRQHCAGESSVTLAAWQFAVFFCVGSLGLLLLPLFAPLLAGIEGAAFATRPAEPVGAVEIGTVFLIGLCAICGTATLATGYRGAASSSVGLFDYSFLLWAPLIGWVLGQEPPNARVASGMALIFAAGCLAVWSGRRRQA